MAIATMPKVPLGRGGPLVARLGFGLMGMSSPSYGSIPDDSENFKLLDRAYELGATFWDSADLYGENERLVGEWFRRTGKRNDIFFATKFGFVRGGPKFGALDSSAEYCKKACAESLQKLGIDSIDLYYMHHANRDTPIEETMRAMAELRAEGKIKHIGLSAISSTTLRRAVKVAPVAAVQVEYSPFVRDAETEAGTHLLETCRELGVAVVPSSPLGRGMVTADFAMGAWASGSADPKDQRPNVMPRFKGENLAQNTALVASFGQLASARGCSTTQLALAWLMAQGDDIIPIPGTKRIKYLEDNIGSLQVKMNKADEQEVRRFVEGADVAGSYMPPAFADYIYRDTKEDVSSA